MKEKFNNKFNIWLKKPEHGQWEKTEYLVKVTEHGTICREDLKDACEKANTRKGKDYTKGLTTGVRKPFGHFRKEYKHSIRVREMRILLEKNDKDGLTPKETNRYKKLRLLERGNYDPKNYKSDKNIYKNNKVAEQLGQLAAIRAQEEINE